MSAETARLAEAVAAAAASIPDAHVRTLAERIATTAGPAQAYAIVREPPVANFTAAATAIIEAWGAMGTPCAAPVVAAMLDAARATRRKVESAQRVELVWTGPDSRLLRARPTSQVVTDLVDSARRTLILVSFATTRVERIHRALSAAADRGVDISLVLETSDASGGRYKSHGPDPFAGIRAHRYTWSAEKRPADTAGAVLHAKLVIADGARAFVTSANLTGRALDANMEAGVTIDGGPLPAVLQAHFDELAYDGVLVPLTG